MSNYTNQYSSYSGNPYESEQQQQAGGYGASNPYGGSAGYEQQQYTGANTYETPGAQTAVVGNPVVPGLNVQYVQPGPSVLSNGDFLSRVEVCAEPHKSERACAAAKTLTHYVGCESGHTYSNHTCLSNCQCAPAHTILT